MSAAEIAAVAAVLLRTPNLNLLIFGLTHESLLWFALNHHGRRTVLVDENEYRVAKFEESNPGIEAYDVQFGTKVSDYRDLLSKTKAKLYGECRPIKNLLFSECDLAINDLPNHVYEIPWDVILVDVPVAPGKMAAIFTAADIVGEGRWRQRREEIDLVILWNEYREVMKCYILILI